MNCLIIGTGWLGYPLGCFLLKNGYTVTGTKRSIDSLTPIVSFPIVQYPSENDCYTTAFRGADIVILAFPPNRQSLQQYTDDCLAVCSLVTNQCKVILISSTSVYDSALEDCTEGEFTEDHTATNSIQLAEQALRKQLGSRLTIIRMAGLIGPNRYPVRSMAISGKVYWSNQPINVIHQHDAIGLIEHIITHAIWGETINGCSPEHPLRGEYYSWMADQLAITTPLFENTTEKSKRINSDKSIKLGFIYTYPNPFEFPLDN